MENRTIKSFEELTVWQVSATMVKEVYKLTKTFPASEKFALTDQVQRSALSVPANIAEGFGRMGRAEKLQFYNIAYGSLLETKSHLLIAKQIGYLSDNSLADVLDIITSIQKLINASRKAI